ncbi:hypothetical protein ACQ33O_06045 [Ferruginibacter sp. SUN002]|uniref:hypothetical protein n=1 Tax=Ferruginibacter sp. SUN002 TaxID=2937789 RepID=UPI003D35CDE7
MSGALQPDFRQGNRSEYLAQYLLSYLGTTVCVPRQEDVGIDFNCAISVNNGHIEEIKEQFHVQIKSNITDDIEFGEVVKTGKDKKVRWKNYELEWLFNLDNPLFVGIINKDDESLELYSTSFMWFNYWNRKFLTIKFLPNTPNGDMEEIHAMADIDISEWASELETEVPKVKTVVPMGPPVIKLTKDNVRQGDFIIQLKRLCRLAIQLEQANITYKKLRLPYFNWLHKISTNNHFVGGYFYAIDKVLNEEQRLYQSLTPILISLALLYKHTTDPRFDTIMNSLKLVPLEFIPPEVRDTLGL